MPTDLLGVLINMAWVAVPLSYLYVYGRGVHHGKTFNPHRKG